MSAHRIYHSPKEGFYDSDGNLGRSNTNDIFVFMTDTNTDVQNPRGDPRAGTGQMYVFQFPVDYFETEDVTALAVIPIGSTRNYQAKSAPVLADGGLSLYWSMVRGEFRGWIDQRFSRGHSSIISLGRGDPAYIAGRASPTIGADDSVYGPGAGLVVFKADSLLENVTTAETDGIVSGRLALTLDDEYIAYGTQSGSLAMLSTSDMTPKWTLSSTLKSIKGDLAVDEYRIFVGDDGGNSVGSVVAFEIAYREVPPTSPPTSAPTDIPTRAPTTMAPTTTPTASPTLEPTRLGLLESTFKPSAIGADGDTTLAPTRLANASRASYTCCISTMFVVLVWGAAIMLLW